MLNHLLCSKMASVIAYYWLVADVIATVVRWYKTRKSNIRWEIQAQEPQLTTTVTSLRDLI